MEFLQSFWKYLSLSSPYLLFGLFIAGVIQQFLNVNRIKKSFGGAGIGSVFKAAFLGIPLPLCSCAVIPAAVTLRKGGANTGATSSFLIATPESGVDSIAVTYGMMDLPMTIIRPIAAFFSAFVAGVFQLIFNSYEYKEEPVAVPEGGEKKSCCASKKAAEKKRSFAEVIQAVFKFGFGKLINDISLWLLIGLLIGAAIDYFVPMDFFSNLNGWVGRLIILGVGIPMYICASATTPIAASLVMKGMSPGMSLLILLVGPATNVANILVIQKYIGKKGVIINILSIAIVALGFSFLTDYLYAAFTWPVDYKVSMNHDHSEIGWQGVCSIILLILIAKGLWIEEIHPRLNKKPPGGCH